MTTTFDKQKAPEENVSRLPEQPVGKDLENKDRRTVIRKLAVGTAALAGCSLLPDKWTTPLVEFGALPAHAQTSGEIMTQPEAVTAAPEATAPETTAADAAAPEATPTEPEATATAPDFATTSSDTAAPATDVAAAGSGNFSLVFVQTVMPCASCGIWFDSVTLEIVHSEGTFTSSQSGFIVKKASGSQGNFTVDISSIPASATIQSATLYMRLNSGEGIANSDNRSVLNVYDYSSGSRGELVRTITASGDIKGAGYSKSNPNVPIDFTAYAKQVHGK